MNYYFLFGCSFNILKREEVFVIVIRSGAVTIAASILPSLNETFFFLASVSIGNNHLHQHWMDIYIFLVIRDKGAAL
jgi:hypothetical protein